MPAIQQITALIHANSSFAGPLCLVVALLGCLLGTNLLLIGPLLAPVITFGISSAILFLWSASDR